MMLREFSFSWKHYVVPLESTLCVLSPKPCIVVIGMNTRRTPVRRVYEEIANAGVPALGNQDPSLK